MSCKGFKTIDACFPGGGARCELREKEFNVMKRKRLCILILALTMVLGLFNPGAWASAALLPGVSEEMTEPGFWTREDADADTPLMSMDEISALNRRIVDTPACKMTDMRAEQEAYDASALRRLLWAAGFDTAAAQMRAFYYGAEGEVLDGSDLLTMVDRIGETNEADGLRYGICVRRADMRSLPNDPFATDEQGDLNYNEYQLYGVRINEPLLVKAVSKDGAYYYCDAECCSGWLPADCVALCADREEWLDAWDIPGAEAVVVTDGKVYLETTNVNAETSNVMLTIGTVLRQIAPEDYDPQVTGRSAVHNYPVWLPIRQADGSYARSMALISQNKDVSEGYLPLTRNNILRVAFSMLGDTYGWGAMLNSADCSAYVRDIYRCFGLVLPRNTTWQAEMPVYRVDVGDMSSEEKERVLDTLPAGAVLYFNGHEMMYLGASDGQYYVISAVSTVRDFESENRLRLRSVSINSLDIQRMNGKTWLESLNLMLVPYLPPETGLKGWSADSEALASLMQFVSESVDESHAGYIPPEDRIAVFDFDGTLYGERFPTGFNLWFNSWRALHCEGYEAPERLKNYAAQEEARLLYGTEFKVTDADAQKLFNGSGLFEGLTREEYTDLVRRFKEVPVWGFEGMTYGEGCFQPMLSLLGYLHENGYSIYICSGSDRDATRVMTEGKLDQYIPADHVIGTDFLYKASGQGDRNGSAYTMGKDEKLIISGCSDERDVKTNKAIAIQREIGRHPVLVFGNTPGDFSMADYVLQNSRYRAQAYMLLCDDTERDYGDTEIAESFAAQCEAAGYHTVSMRDDFLTVYGGQVHKTAPENAGFPVAA